jgi:hypothetical protein
MKSDGFTQSGFLIRFASSALAIAALIVVSAIHLSIKHADASRDARSCVSTFDSAELKIKAAIEICIAKH